jgi:hypothetical protein
MTGPRLTGSSSWPDVTGAGLFVGLPRLQEENVLRLGRRAPAFRIFETWISEKLRSDLSLQASSLSV